MQVFSFALISDLCPLKMRYPVTTTSVRPSLPYPYNVGLIITPGQ